MKNAQLMRFVSLSFLLASLPFSSGLAQNSTNKKEDSKVGKSNNMMLNASDDNGPRAVNIGLPASVGGTTILENGLPVVYDFVGQSPILVWRNDAGVAKFKTLNVAETARSASDVGVSVSTYTNRGTDKFRGSAGFTTNSFGLLRGDVGISGPLKRGFQYSVTAFVNFDPTTYRSNISTFMDKTQIYKGVLNKRYKNGQIGVQYKFASSESYTSKQSPYIYHKNGKVSALPGFRIGRDAYIEQSGRVNLVDPLTGERRNMDAMKDFGSQSHIIDLMGDHKFGNGMLLDYTIRYHYAKSGSIGPYLTSIIPTDNASPEDGSKRYFYVDSPHNEYQGLVQNAMMIASPKSVKNTIMGRIELSKQSNKHFWMVGVHNWSYMVDKANAATYNYQFEVAPNPRGLLMEQYQSIKDENGHVIGGEWVQKTTDMGTRNDNIGMQYYDGLDNKTAIVAAETWTPHRKLSIDLGGRFEWQRINGKWYKTEDRIAAKSNWVSGKLSDIKKNWFNTSVTGSATYKAFKNFGFLADVMYIQQAGNLNLYGGGDDPQVKKSVTTGFSAGVYFNHPNVSFVSKLTQIRRTNFNNNSTFNSPDGTEIIRKVINYDVSTLGWTTDMVITPFKGFNLHMLLTLQNPKYKNYDFEVFGEQFSNSDNVARSVSKVLIEIDPSYTWKKLRIWGSARYFSKEYANYPNTLTFKGRWETFAGVKYMYNREVEFGVNVVNLFNQSGAQGSISGTNTTTAEQAKALYNKPLAGTYIRPFTVEFSTKIKF